MRKFYTRLNTKNRLFSLLFTANLLFSAQTIQAQVPGNALSYNGTDQFTTLPSGIVQNITGDFTIEAWVFWRGGGTFQRILDLGFDQNTWIALCPSSNFGPTFGVVFGVNYNNSFQYVVANSSLPINAWSHIAVTLQNSTGLVTVYINGVNSGTVNMTHRLSDLGNTPINKIGESKYADPYLNAVVDELRISNNIRYSSNFTPPTTAFTVDANTVAYYRFEEGDPSQTSADASGNFAAAIRGGSTLDANNDPSWLNTNLPVRLHSFEGFVNARSINLQWKAQMDAASTFELQRSADGIRFSSIGTITEANGTATAKTFTLADAAPLSGRNYYRLKYQETGGPVLYSRVISLVFDAAGKPVVYPNPVRGRFINVDFIKPLSGEAELRLVNTSGAEVARQKARLANQREWQVTKPSNLPAGSYLLSVVVDGKQNFSAMITVE
jgi:hypothetical protein